MTDRLTDGPAERRRAELSSITVKWHNLLSQKPLLVLQTVRNLVCYYLVTSTLNVADPRGWIWPPQDKLLLRLQLRAVVVVPLLNISWTVFSFSHNDMNVILVQEN